MSIITEFNYINFAIIQLVTTFLSKVLDLHPSCYESFPVCVTLHKPNPPDLRTQIDFRPAWLPPLRKRLVFNNRNQ